MSGSHGTTISFRNRRCPLKAKGSNLRKLEQISSLPSAVLCLRIAFADSAFGAGPGTRQDHARPGHRAGAPAQPRPAGRAHHHPAEPGPGDHGQPAPQPDVFHRLGIPPPACVQPGGGLAHYLHDSTEGDIGLSYLFERGKKRQHRLEAAQDTTAVTRVDGLRQRTHAGLSGCPALLSTSSWRSRRSIWRTRI